jgi:hypothetical protein
MLTALYHWSSLFYKFANILGRYGYATAATVTKEEYIASSTSPGSELYVQGSASAL